MDFELNIEHLAAIVGFVTAALQMAKKLPFLSDRPKLLPWLSLPLGAAIEAVVVLLTAPGPWTAATVGGVIVYGALGGLGACGLYDVAGKSFWKSVEWVVAKLPTEGVAGVAGKVLGGLFGKPACRQAGRTDRP